MKLNDRNAISKKQNYLSYDVLDMIELEQAKSKLDTVDAQVLVTCVPVTKIVTVTQISSSEGLPMNLV